MLKKRIIPCLDIKNGQVVKGVNFANVQVIADPIELARYYNETGADELVFYDISAALESRSLFRELLENVAREIFIPLCVGGNIRSLADIDLALKSGADKVSINSGALLNPDIINAGAQKYGRQCIVASVDVKRNNQRFEIYSHGGQTPTGKEALSWIDELVERGAGELVLNSIDTDGVRQGFDLELLNAVCSRVSVPVIASGGAGKIQDFVTLFEETGADAGLAASIFHHKEVVIDDLKRTLNEQGIAVRLSDYGTL